MRIVVSGTHASGKSTLISDFAVRHPQFTVLPDPFELIDDAWDAPGAAMFARQLRVAADRLRADEPEGDVIAERGPLDFLAYLLALEELSGASAAPEQLERAADLTADALRRVDLLVVLPLSASDPIRVGEEEHPELREVMNDVLLDLLGDPDIVDSRLEVVELVGDPGHRLASLESAVAAHHA